MKLVYLSLLLAALAGLAPKASAQQDQFQQLFPNPSLIAINPENPDNFLVGGGDGAVLKTTDAGETWSLSGLRSGNGFGVSGIAFLGGDTVFASASQVNDVVYRSLDGGDTWTALQLAYTDAQSKTLVQPTGIPGAVMLGTGVNGSYLITRDGGATVDTFQRSGTVYAIGNGTLLSASPSFSSTTTYRSDDLGKSWTLVAQGASHPFQVLLDGWDLNAYDANKWIIRANRQSDILVTTDGGSTMSQVDPGVSNVNLVKWSSATEVIAFGNTRTATSTDAGLTWTQTTFTAPAGVNIPVDRYAIDENGTEIGAYGREIYTRAAGATDWELKRFYLPFERISSFIVGPNNTHFVNFNNVNRPEYSGGYRTDDDGVTWQALSRTAGDYIPLYVSSQGEIYAARASNTLHRSTDGGLTYTQVFTSSAGTGLFRIFSPSEGIVVAYSTEGNAVSYDNGETWTSYQAAGVYLAEGINEIAVLNAGTWSITVSRGQFFALHVTQDTGRTYTRITLPAQAAEKQLSAGGGALWMAPRWKSTDKGATWQVIDAANFPGSFSSIDFRNDQEGIMRTSGGNYFTEDGGETWELGGQGITNGEITASGWQNGGTKGFVSGVSLPLYRYDKGAWDTLTVPATNGGGSSAVRELVKNAIRLSPNPATAGSTIRIEFASDQTNSSQFSLLDAMGRRVAILQSENGRVDLPEVLPKGVYVLVDEAGKSAGRLLIH